MQNDAGEFVDLYCPRKCRVTHGLPLCLGQQPADPRQGPRVRAAGDRGRGPGHGARRRRQQDVRGVRRHPPHGRVRRLHRAPHQEGRHPC